MQKYNINDTVFYAWKGLPPLQECRIIDIVEKHYNYKDIYEEYHSGVKYLYRVEIKDGDIFKSFNTLEFELFKSKEDYFKFKIQNSLNDVLSEVKELEKELRMKKIHIICLQKALKNNDFSLFKDDGEFDYEKLS